jgi:hypothetical protein
MTVWFDKFIATLWMFLILAFGSAIVLGNQSTNRILNKQAGILVETVKESTKWVKSQIRLGLFTTLEVSAQFDFLLEKLSQAAIRFLKKLIESAFSAIKKVLNKIKDTLYQSTVALTNSKVARNILGILSGRINVCQKIDSWINGIFESININFGMLSPQSAFEYAYNSTGEWFNKTVVTMWSPPVEAAASDCDFNLFPKKRELTSPTGGLNCKTETQCKAMGTVSDIATSAIDAYSTDDVLSGDKLRAAAETKLTELKDISTNSANGRFVKNCTPELLLIPTVNRDCSVKSDTILSSLVTGATLQELQNNAKSAAEKVTPKADSNILVQAQEPKSVATGKFGSNPLGPDAKLKFSATGDPTLNLVSSEYSPTLTPPSVTPESGLLASTTDLSIKSSASAGEGDDSFDSLLPKILDELSNLALEFIDILFSAVNYISCGVLNFQDFCNATTQLSTKLEQDVTAYFDGLKANIKGKVSFNTGLKDRMTEVANNSKKPNRNELLMA